MSMKIVERKILRYTPGNASQSIGPLVLGKPMPLIPTKPSVAQSGTQLVTIIKQV